GGDDPPSSAVGIPVLIELVLRICHAMTHFLNGTTAWIAAVCRRTAEQLKWNNVSSPEI
ncbi:uncharacterized, partial [Tachysurus ichikawai]